MDGTWMEILAWPFSLPGKGLRWLSLSGSAGNAVAILLYILIALLPFLLKWKRKWRREDWLLPLASVTILYTLYFEINPGLRPFILNYSIGSVACAMAVYSVLLLWGILQLLRCCETKETAYMYSVLRALLRLCAVLFLLMGAVIGFGGFLEKVNAVKAANTAPGINLIPTNIVLFGGFLTDALEYGLDAMLMLLGVRLLKEMEKEPYSEACHDAAVLVGTWCKRALIIMLAGRLLLNFGLILFAGKLYEVSTQFTVPVFSVVLVLGALVLTKLLDKGRQLKEDNELFI